MFKLTPESLVELIVLSVHWENWSPSMFVPKYSTVDRILSASQLVGLLTKEQVRMLQSSACTPYARKLQYHCGTFNAAERFVNDFTLLLCRHRRTPGAPNYPVLMSTTHLFPCVEGEQRIEEFTRKHAGIIEKDALLAAFAELPRL